MTKWINEIERLKNEAKESIKKAGGNPDGFDLDTIAEFLFACQCNGIDITRISGDRHLYVSYNPPLRGVKDD